jgi:hypothetical protein
MSRRSGRRRRNREIARFPSCYTCCRVAFIASVTRDYSPTPTASAISPPLASFCISRRLYHPPTAMLIGAAHGPPSSADTAARRCLSSRPSHARNTSADRQLHRVTMSIRCSIAKSSPSALLRHRLTRTPIVVAADIQRSCTPQPLKSGSYFTDIATRGAGHTAMVPPSAFKCLLTPLKSP